MDTIRLSSLSAVAGFLSLISVSTAGAQSLSMQPFSGSVLCAGDSITVAFDVTGYFGHKNAFTLQLSDPTGSFNNGILNIASLRDTLPGSFSIHTTIPSVTASTHYRLRMMSAVPYAVTADNGSDVTIGTGYHHDLQQFTALVIDSPFTFHAFAKDPHESGDSLHWDLGEGANPRYITDTLRSPEMSSATTRYATAGARMSLSPRFHRPVAPHRTRCIRMSSIAPLVSSHILPL